VEEAAMTGSGGHNDAGARNRMYRNPQRGVLFGVCAGGADYFGFEVSMTRIALAISAFFFPILILAYLLLALILPRQSEPGERDPVAGRVHAEPHDTLSGIRYRFRDLEKRLQRLETYVTSSRFKLDREFRDLRE
jgi:phage shock protein C